MDDYKRIAAGASSPDEAEERIIKAFHGLPDDLLDPLKLAEVRGVAGKQTKEQQRLSPAETIINAHISNFEQGYANKLPNAKAIGYQRNVEGQGMPGTEQWAKRQKEAKPHQPAKEIPSTTKG